MGMEGDYRWDERNNMNMSICRFNACGKEYDIDETIRSFGDMVWTSIYCSAQCYTKAITQGQKITTSITLPNVIYLVIRHQGQHDDYRADPIKAFKDKKMAEDIASLCKKEADRIIDEILIWKDAHADLFKLPEYGEVPEGEDEEAYYDKLDEQISKEHKDGIRFFEKIVELYKTHKYDPDMNEHDDIDYTVMELEIE
jgi:hypothetical protein